MISDSVRPFVPSLTEATAREVLAKPLLSACSTHGPKAVGATLGCDEKTVRNARDEKSTLRLDYAANLLTLDPLAWDGFLARVGRRSVPIGSVCDTDAGRAHESKVLKAALAMSIALSDDEKITVKEIVANLDTIEAAHTALGELLDRAAAAKHRVRAA
ncbi:MAG: hypothetical protein ACOYBT_10020 [Polynucleobacter sp.]